MSRAVLLTDGAARDLDELFAAAYDREGAAQADSLLNRIQVSLERIGSETPGGRTLPELRRMGLDDVRVLRQGDLRFVFRVRDAEVVLVLIANQGRSMQSLLQRRVFEV